MTVHRPGKINTAAEALSRTLMSKMNKENQDEYLVYPGIDDVYQITEKQSINTPVRQGNPQENTIDKHINPELSSNLVKSKDWKLETKKDCERRKYAGPG